MKGIELLPIGAEQSARLKSFALQYKRNARIEMEVVSFEEGRVIVRVEQKELVNGLQLSKKELESRVRELFAGELSAEWRLTVSAVDYDRKDIDAIGTEWVKQKMARFGMKGKHLSAHTGIDKSTISLMLAGEKELTKWHKVALYYFFKYMELSHFGG